MSEKNTFTLVLLRHGQSQWNHSNRFTGWADIDLTEQGIAEAKKAGVLLKEIGFFFDKAYASVLKRSIRTLWGVLDVMDLMWLPVTCDWHLNERDYGALQGLDKSEVAKKFGADQVTVWRRGYDVSPPSRQVPNDFGEDSRYKDIFFEKAPNGESLKDTAERVIPYWKKVIAPEVLLGKRLLVVAHGNSLRALVKHLDSISDEMIMKYDIPNACPLVYQLDKNLVPISSYYLWGGSSGL